jgi:hypothetical protein
MGPTEKEVRKLVLCAYFAIFNTQLNTENSLKLLGKVYGLAVNILFLRSYGGSK